MGSNQGGQHGQGDRRGLRPDRDPPDRSESVGCRAHEDATIKTAVEEDFPGLFEDFDQVESDIKALDLDLGPKLAVLKDAKKDASAATEAW